MGGFVRGITGADKAARESRRGAAMAAGAQQEALDYLKEREAIPQELREASLQQLAGLFGIGGVPGEEALATIQGSPMYQAVLGQQQAGEEAILRNAAATGGLRSGNVQDALARYSGDLQNQALTQSLTGLQGLAQLPSNANQIAATTAGIGETLAQGRIASGQAKAAGQMGFLTGLMGMGSAAAGAGAFSDARLKAEVRKIGERGGYNWYSWKWNDEAKTLGLIGPDEGVMAHEVMETNPEAVTRVGDYLVVDYRAIGVQ
ncbi:tail fiber domain-containing protein [Zhongshania sp.]|uniref:tail fiber domain-containing protein n=1 Tax=Zhongshania sp. TaxID=1971902 RepID=UPI003564FFA8